MEVAVGHIFLYPLVVPDAVNLTDMIANRISGIYGVSDSRQTFHWAGCNLGISEKFKEKS